MADNWKGLLLDGKVVLDGKEYSRDEIEKIKEDFSLREVETPDLPGYIHYDVRVKNTNDAPKFSGVPAIRVDIMTDLSGKIKLASMYTEKEEAEKVQKEVEKQMKSDPDIKEKRDFEGTEFWYQKGTRKLCLPDEIISRHPGMVFIWYDKPAAE